MVHILENSNQWHTIYQLKSLVELNPFEQEWTRTCLNNQRAEQTVKSGLHCKWSAINESFAANSKTLELVNLIPELEQQLNEWKLAVLCCIWNKQTSYKKLDLDNRFRQQICTSVCTHATRFEILVIIYRKMNSLRTMVCTLKANLCIFHAFFSKNKQLRNSFLSTRFL